jgi:hypothetical protein
MTSTILSHMTCLILGLCGGLALAGFLLGLKAPPQDKEPS